MMHPEARLLAAIKNKRAPHAILVTGPEGSDTASVARRAAALFCTGAAEEAALLHCPDYQELGQGGTGVDDIRNMQAALIPRPFSGNRAIVFLNAHSMTEAAQNALLKTLEEPPHDTMLLLSGDENGLLYTIRSRCGIIRLPLMAEEALRQHLVSCGYPEKAARLAAFLSDGAPLLAEKMVCEEYQLFYAQAVKLYENTLFAPAPLPPYGDLQALLQIYPFAAPEQKLNKTEERRESGRQCLRIWQHIAREQLHGKLGLLGSFPALAQKSRAGAERFTIRQIQGIIEMVLSAERRIGVANPQLTMDALITALCVPVDKRKGIPV